jgi:N-ethylmaleimide reductase
VREDHYGGDPHGRSRFALEVLDAMIAAWSADHIAVRLSPGFRMGGFSPTPQTLATYEHLIGRISERTIAYLHLVNPSYDVSGAPVEALKAGSAKYFRGIYPGTLMINGGMDWDGGNNAIASGEADLVSFAKPYTANPDLVERFTHQLPLAQGNPDTYYRGGATGYTDYDRAASISA